MSSLMEEMFVFMKYGSSMNVGASNLEAKHIVDDPPLVEVKGSLGV